MGDIADMMLDGTLCQVCGEYIGTNNDYPTTCEGCKVDDTVHEVVKVKCNLCRKLVKKGQGLRDHMRVKHSK